MFLCRLIRFSLIRAGFGQKPNQTAHFSLFHFCSKTDPENRPEIKRHTALFYATLSSRPPALEPTVFDPLTR
jgi:hypothetical protein